jgi:1-acyl-sn-glycerol-3-phosphate acyltransferase
LNYLARETLFHSRTLAWLIDLYDGIPIQRDGLGLSGLKETLRRLRRGEMVLVFPEGTRSWDGQLGPLKPGICAIARRSQVPLVPVAVAGAFEAWPRSQRLPGRAAVWVQFGPPILPVEAAQLSDEALLAELADRLQGCFTRAEAARQP